MYAPAAKITAVAETAAAIRAPTQIGTTEARHATVATPNHAPVVASVNLIAVSVPILVQKARLSKVFAKVTVVEEEALCRQFENNTQIM